jgi:hypothetical protein
MPGAKRGRIEQFRDNRIVELDRRRVPRQPLRATRMRSQRRRPKRGNVGAEHLDEPLIEIDRRPPSPRLWDLPRVL